MRRPALWAVIVAAAAAACVVIAAFPGSAGASTVSCKGSTIKVEDPDVENRLDYRFSCTEKVIAYSIITNRNVDYFDPEVEVFIGPPREGNVSSESFSCEGPIPGNGFGCKGSASAPDATSVRVVEGGIGFQRDVCSRHAKGAGFRSWLVVTTQQLDFSGKPFTISSEPFRLNGPGCKANGSSNRPAKKRLATRR